MFTTRHSEEGHLFSQLSDSSAGYPKIFDDSHTANSTLKEARSCDTRRFEIRREVEIRVWIVRRQGTTKIQNKDSLSCTYVAYYKQAYSTDTT